jgi:hypothetical protein
MVTLSYSLLIGVPWLWRVSPPQWPTPRRLSLAASATAAGLVMLAWTRWDALSHDTLEVLPLSAERAAVVFQPAGSDQPLLAVPDTLTYWEHQHLTGWIRHRNLSDHITWLILPSPTAPSPQEDTLTRLAEVPPRGPVFYPGNAHFTKPPLAKSWQALYPNQVLLLGGFQAYLQPETTLQVRHSNFCLTATQTEPSQAAATCQAVLTNASTQGARLTLKGLPTMAAGALRWTKLQIDGSQLRILN